MKAKQNHIKGNPRSNLRAFTYDSSSFSSHTKVFPKNQEKQCSDSISFLFIYVRLAIAKHLLFKIRRWTQMKLSLTAQEVPIGDQALKTLGPSSSLPAATEIRYM